MKKEIKIIGLLIVLCLLFSTSIPSFACPIDDNSYSAETEENIDNYKIVYEDGNYYVRPIRSRIGSGIGKCPQQKKTFYKTFTRAQAKAALGAEIIGNASITTLLNFLEEALGNLGLPGSQALELIGGKNILEEKLRSFLDSGASSAQFVIYTHCVSRGNMYGEPMYDFAIDSITIRY